MEVLSQPLPAYTAFSVVAVVLALVYRDRLYSRLPGPSWRAALAGGLAGGIALTLATHGTDQFLVQRLLSADSPKSAARGLVLLSGMSPGSKSSSSGSGSAVREK